jgi:hypothetical protein
MGRSCQVGLQSLQAQSDSGWRLPSLDLIWKQFEKLAEKAQAAR